MTTSVASVGRKGAILLAVVLTVPAARNATAQQNMNGAAQPSVVPMSPMAADAHPSFEVATIKAADPNQLKGNFRIGGHRIYLESQSVDSLLTVAYAIHQKQIVDGPAWLDTQRYDIVGQADVEGVPNLHQIQEMLQKLLESRFNIRFHPEKRELSIYAIIVAKSGPKLAKSASGSNGLPAQTGGGTGGEQIRTFTNNSMSDFALGMQAYLDKPVVDETGLTGIYDFVLKWTPDESNANELNAPPGIFTAVQEQLGLKLEPTRGPTDVLVIDHVERPSEN
jgi:uncharacterized protein (TIGR03435 family)